MRGKGGVNLLQLELPGYNMNPRRQCEYTGCIDLGRNKGWYKESVRYGRFCEKHHRIRKGGIYAGKQSIPNDVCEKCGWKESYCDRHRLVREKGYCRENVIVLCPNCHRLAHLKREV